LESVVSFWSVIYVTLLSPWGIAASVTKLIIYASSLLSAGLLLFRIALPKAGDELSNFLKPLALASIIVAILATIIRVLVQAGRMNDDGIAGMLDLDVILISLGGPLGASTYLRLGGLLALFIATFLKPMRVLATLVGALMVTGSFALTGHATRDPQWLLGGLIIFHLMAISYWFGALPGLYRLAHPDHEASHAAEVADRFGKQASFIVPMLIVAGTIFLWLILGDPYKLFKTNYGVIMLVKLGLVSAVLLLAALNKLKFVPELAASATHASSRFRSSLRWEAFAFFLVFACTAVLTTSFTVPV
jgi:putative copper resistance protein D